MLQAESQLLFQGATNQNTEENMFERTACFGDEDNKENATTPILAPFEYKRSISVGVSPGRSRHGTRENGYALRKRISADQQKREPMITERETRLETFSAMPMVPTRKILSENSHFKENKNINNLHIVDSSQFSYAKNRKFKLELSNQITDRSDQAEMNITFSPTKVQPIQNFSELRPPRSESCLEPRSGVVSRVDSREKGPVRAASPGGKYSINLGRLNRIKVLSPLPSKNPNCFSPPIMKRPREIPKSFMEIEPLNLGPAAESRQELINPISHPIYRKFMRKGSMQDALPNPNDGSLNLNLSQVKDKNSSIYSFMDIGGDSPTSKEYKFKLPSIIQPRKSDAAPIRAGPIKPQNLDEKWGLQKYLKEQPLKISRPPLDDSPTNKQEPCSAGFDSQRGAIGSRFKMEEMILNKLFKPN